MQNADFTMFSEKPAAPHSRRRSEIVRILIFLGITLGIQLSINLVWSAFLSLVYSQVSLSGMIVTVISLIGTLVSALTAGVSAIVNRAVTFRAKFPWWAAMLIMMGARLLWQLAASFLIALAYRVAGITPGVSMAVRLVMMVLWLMVQYIFQRCVLFRATLDQR